MGFLEDLSHILRSLEDVSNLAKMTLPFGNTGREVISETLGLSRSEYQSVVDASVPSCSIADAPCYSGHPFEIVDENVPAFSDEELASPLGYESYSDLDEFGRCGVAFALVSKETMPKLDEVRKPIKHVVPSGWNDIEYDFIEGKKLYNRCHLIGYGLTAEQDNPKNIITGTHYLNHAMRVFENMVADHCKVHDGARVLFRATPHFFDNELVARGVQLEALSICEDDVPIQFNVYLYNVQPRVAIDYRTGDSSKDDSVKDSMLRNCMVNDATKIFHKNTCSTLSLSSADSIRNYSGLRQGLLDAGYRPCGKCKP